MSIRSYLLNSFLLPRPFDRCSVEDPSRADFICPQALGRNTYSDSAVGAIVNPVRAELCDSDNITTFEWLKLQQFDPGYPNRLLAEYCHSEATVDLRRNPKDIIPVVGQ